MLVNIFSECGRFLFLPSKEAVSVHSLNMTYDLRLISPSFIPFEPTSVEYIRFIGVYQQITIEHKLGTGQGDSGPVKISLPIEHVFKVVHVITWRNKIPRYNSNVTNEEINRIDMAIECPHGRLFTDVWLCKDGTKISTDHVCDTENDCPDGSDEYQELCEGEETLAMKLIKVVLSSNYLLGTIVFSLSLVIKYYCKHDPKLLHREKNTASFKKLNSLTNKRNDCKLKLVDQNKDHDNERKKVERIFAQLKKIVDTIYIRYLDTKCKKITNLEDALLEEMLRFNKMYETLHSNGDKEHKCIFFAIKYLSTMAEYKDGCCSLIHHIHRFEFNVLHNGKPEEAIKCLTKYLSVDNAHAEAYISMLEGNSYCKVDNSLATRT